MAGPAAFGPPAAWRGSAASPRRRSGTARRTHTAGRPGAGRWFGVRYDRHRSVTRMSDSLHSASPQQLALFADRIGRSLAERPLVLGETEHRERVATMVREVGGATFYQLLAVEPTATPEQVHEG